VGYWVGRELDCDLGREEFLLRRWLEEATIGVEMGGHFNF
jgi:hypothetical protein